MMGWKGFTNTRERLFGEVADRIIRQAPCDLMVLKIAGSRRLHRCLFPTAGGPNARLATDFLTILADAFDMKVTAGYVVPPDASEEEELAAERWMEKTLIHVGETVELERELIPAKSVAGGLALASRDFDLVVVGAAKEPFFRRILVGEIPEKVARYSPASVLIVKRYEGPVKSWLKRVLG
jgi:nucleotide-binding universal stress UspA family protein